MPDPPKLPKKAPQELKDFVACTRDDVELDLARADWVPKPKKVPESLAPEVTAEPGPTADSANVSVGWGFIAITLPVSIVDGHLQVDTSNLSAFDDLVGPMNDWVRQLNDALDANGKALDGLSIRNGKVVLRKRRVGAATPSTAVPGTGTGAAPQPTGPAPPATAPVPAPAPATPPSSGPGCLLGILVGVLALGLLGAGTLLVTRGDDAGTAPPVPASDQDLSSTAPTSSATPTTPPPPRWHLHRRPHRRRPRRSVSAASAATMR